MLFWLPDLQLKTSYVNLRKTYIVRSTDGHNKHRKKRNGIFHGHR